MSLFNLKKYINNILKENSYENHGMVLWDWLQENMPRMGFGHTEWQNKWFQERNWSKSISKDANLIVQVLPFSRNLGEIEDIEISVYGNGKLLEKNSVPVFYKGNEPPEHWPNFTFNQIIERIEFFIKQFEDDWKNEEFEGDLNPIWEWLMDRLPQNEWSMDRKDGRIWTRVFRERYGEQEFITRVQLLIRPLNIAVKKDVIHWIDLVEELYRPEREDFREINNAEIRPGYYNMEDLWRVLEDAIQNPLQFIERNP